MTGAGAPVVAAVRPDPDPGVLAAIVAAVDAAWPRPSPSSEPAPRTPAWRFSGRFWALPAAARRDRPWVRGR